MGVGISIEAAEWWKSQNPEEYADYYMSEGDGYVWITELPDWATDPNEGYFYIDDDGAIWTISTRPSQNGIFIGNLI